MDFITKRGLKKLFKGDHRMSLLIDYISRQRATSVRNEVPAGVVDGSNKTFTLEHTPRGDVGLFLYPGIILHPDDFTMDGKTITLAAHVDAPVDEECLLANYEY